MTCHSAGAVAKACEFPLQFLRTLCVNLCTQYPFPPSIVASNPNFPRFSQIVLTHTFVVSPPIRPAPAAFPQIHSAHNNSKASFFLNAKTFYQSCCLLLCAVDRKQPAATRRLHDEPVRKSAFPQSFQNLEALYFS